MSGRDLDDLAWCADQLPELMEEVARRQGAHRPDGAAAQPPLRLTRGTPDVIIARAVEACARSLALEAEPVTIAVDRVERVLCSGGPVLVCVPGDEARFLVILRGRRRRAFLLGPDHAVHRVAARRIGDALRAPVVRRLEADVAAVVSGLLPAGSRRRRAVAHLLAERVHAQSFDGCTLLRLAPSASPARQISEAGLTAPAALLLAAHVGEYGAFLLSWVLLGQGALAGRIERGWLVAWMLLLLTAVAFRGASTWLQGRLAVGIGGLLKQRLLHGAMRLDPDATRARGVGDLFGRILESDAVEALLVNGGLLAAFATLEIGAAVVALAIGALWRGALLIVWTGGVVALALTYHRRYREWTRSRRDMTRALLEQMLAHRTRLAQQPPDSRHHGEDEALERYLREGHLADRTAVSLRLAARLWLVAGVGSLGALLVRPGPVDQVQVALAIGAVLLAFQGLNKLQAGLSSLVGAIVSWEEVAPVLAGAASHSGDEDQAARGSLELADAPTGAVLLEAKRLTYRYPARSDLALREASLRIHDGDRLLLEGPSGGGKSTLVSVLAGNRAPSAGLLLAQGLDRHSLGREAWRRRVVAVPQFNDNHILTGTLAFNLLMGRQWPASPADVTLAEVVCRELGLGPLLDRMPAGLAQTVGEGGWRLSQGERSRVYLARALLQGTDLLILDESFGALDPENVGACLASVVARARALMVVAHP